MSTGAQAWQETKSKMLGVLAFTEQRSADIAKAVQVSGREPIGRVPLPASERNEPKGGDTKF